MRNSKQFVEFSRSGQALLEYILLLALVILLFMGSLYQFNDAFRNFVSNYFGNYVACLLETGELPSAGGEDSGGACESDFEPFSLAKGRPLGSSSAGGSRGGGSGGGSSSGNRGSTTGEVSPTKGGAGNNQDLRPSASSVNTGGGSASGGLSSGGRFDTNSSNRNRVGLNGSGSGDDEDYTGSDAISSGGNNFSSSGTTSSETSTIVRGLSVEEDKEEDSKQRPRRTAQAKLQENNLRDAKARVAVEGPKKKIVNSEEESMTFGGFLRLLFAAAIIIALVLLIGGQLLQISKNMDSNG